MVSAGETIEGSMATCGCMGGGWVWMVAVGEVGEARRQGAGDCYFLGWAMDFSGSKVRRQVVFSKFFFEKPSCGIYLQITIDYIQFWLACKL
jgi:hypothetical protein